MQYLVHESIIKNIQIKLQRMLPQKFKDMFGLKDEKDMKMANNIWKMLEEMSSNDPSAYEKFIEKNLSEGLTDAKAEKQKKQKPYKIVPSEYILLQMDAQLEQEYINPVESKEEGQLKFKQKLDMNINKEKWEDVRNKFFHKIRIFLNICHTDRIKNLTSRSKGGEQIKQFHVSMIKDIQNLYYSFQGPHFDKGNNSKPKQEKDVCTSFVRAFEAVPNGRRLFLGICAAYFQERIKADRNPILMKVNTHSLYGKNLYYGIDKVTMEVNQQKKFKYGEYDKPCQFLLQKQIDKKQRDKVVEKSVKQQPKKSGEIMIKPPPVSHKVEQEGLQQLIPASKPKNKVLIEVLDEKEASEQKQDESIPFEMKQTEEGYYFEFLVPGIEKIEDLDLEVSKYVIKLKSGISNGKSGKSVEIRLIKKIDENKVKAKMKKKVHILQVTLYYDK